MSESIEKTIDIDKILKSKMGSKVKFVPRFLVSWLKKIIHEDEVNRFLWESRGLSGTEWLTECVRYLKMDDGKFRYLVNDLLLNLPGLKPVSIGINKTGRQSRDFPRMVEAGFKSDNHMLMFPAGLNSRKRKDGTIHDLPWKKTFISKSVEYQRDVVPIHFGGRNSERFYRIARFSDKYLPFNLAMLFLVDEMYRNVGKHFRISIGKPIPWQTFDKSKSATEWAQYVEDRVYEL